MHLSPDVGTQDWNLTAGYIYQSNSIIGFSHTHWSGVGMSNGGDILFMPTVNTKLQITFGSEENSDSGYRSRYSHEQETATAEYYAVKLLDYNIKVELTPEALDTVLNVMSPVSTSIGVVLIEKLLIVGAQNWLPV